jgi:dTDP-4-dehydrorhamnose 3,5-epimerase-like enzyme
LQSNNISMKKIIRAIHFLTSSDYYLWRVLYGDDIGTNQ